VKIIGLIAGLCVAAGCYHVAPLDADADAGSGSLHDGDTSADAGPQADAGIDAASDGGAGTDSESDDPGCGVEIIELDSAPDFFGVHGMDDGDLWVVGYVPDVYYEWMTEGFVYHFDGEAWTRVTAEIDQSDAVTGVWSFGKAEAFMSASSFGGPYGPSAGYVLHYSGGVAEVEWLAMADSSSGQGYSLMSAIWGSVPDDVYAVGAVELVLDIDADGGETAVRFDGSAWEPIAGTGFVAPDGKKCPDMTAVGGSAADDVWAGGGRGTLAHFDGAAWTTSDDLPVGISAFYGVDDLWVAAPDAAFAAVDALAEGEAVPHPALLRFDGVEWSVVDDLPAVFGSAGGVGGSPVDPCRGAVTGTGVDDIYVSGILYTDGGNTPTEVALAHFDGAAWSLVALDGFDPTGPPWHCINDLWVSPNGVVWGAMGGGLVMRYVSCGPGATPPSFSPLGLSASRVRR
jgi:hypothetical protein